MGEYCLPFYHACDENSLSQHRMIGKQLQFVWSHPLLDDAAKLLWMWMVHHSMYDPNHCCWFSYHQLSQAVNQDVQKIHTALFFLHSVGFLKTNLLNSSEITLLQSVQQRSFLPVLPKYAWQEYRDEAETLFSEELVFKDKDGNYKRPQLFINLMHKCNMPLPCYNKDNPFL